MPAFAAGAEAKVKLPTGRADLLAGKKLFEVQCALCHGPNGEGARGPSLTRARLSHAPDDAALLKVLEDGIRGTEMPGVGAMSGREVRQTAAFVRSLGKVTLKPVPGDSARGARFTRARGIVSAATPSMATVASRGRIYPQSAIRAAPRISANRS